MKRGFIVSIFILYSFGLVFGSMSRLIKWKGKEVEMKSSIENITIGTSGFISLGPSIDTLFKSTEIFLWDCALDSKENLYVSSGNDGNVYRINRNKQVFTVFTSKKGAEIYALAIDMQDNLFIGESPSGIIYKLSRNGKAKEFYSTQEKYIWDLVLDEKGMLFAATGDRGKVFRIKPDGKGEVYYSSNENHVVSLCLVNKELYAGTEPNGLFIKFLSKDNIEVLYDAKENEVHSIVGFENSIFFSTISKPAAPPLPSYTSFFGGGKIPSGDQKTDVSLLYKYDEVKKTVTTLWKCPTPPIYSISDFTQGRILLGTENGRLYSSDSKGNVEQVNRFDVAPILKIGRYKRDSRVVLTGNIGDVLVIGPNFSSTGSITSDVFDTGRKSVFGKVDWNVDTPKGTSFSLALRVGNKENPSDEWTDWKKMKKGQRINVSPSRFIQIKGKLSTASGYKSPTLKVVTISYLPENRSPVIEKLIVCPVGINAGGNANAGFAAMTPLTEKQKTYYEALGFELPVTVYRLQKGKRCAYWKATDPDGDSLSFIFSYKGKEEKEWKQLKKNLKSKSFIWDETALPDGFYTIKLSASDMPDNPATRALGVELVSEPFIVDNSPPEVRVKSSKVRGENIELKVEAEDKLSIVNSCSYSVNGGSWNVVLPVDGIFDSFGEEFSFTIKAKEKGEKTVVIKVMDFALNTGTDKATVEVK